ncbi:MAG: extracellular solute-binding protein [Verrucomicrobia bacterium]|nr:extracellular solute-binding protein [Verrucomicrobiota bacterium]
MKKRRSWWRRLPLGLQLLAVGYIACLAWVFTYGTPVLPQKKITLRIAHWQIEKGPPDGIDEVIKRYEKLHPEVKVEQVLVPGGIYRLWLRTMLSGGEAPDIVEFGAWLENVTDIPLRYFEPLTEPLLEPNPYNQGTPLEGVTWLKTFEDELLEQRSNSPEPGQYYSVTMSRGSWRMFANTDLLKEITGSDQVPTRFDDFLKLCAQVKAYGQAHGKSIMPLAGAKDNATFFAFLYMQGLMAKYTFTMDRDGVLAVDNRQLSSAYLEGRWRWQQPELQASLTILGQLFAQMKPGFLQLTRDDAVQEFMRGDALFVFTGTFDGTTLRRLAPFHVEAYRLPQPTKDDPVIGKYLAGHFVDGDNTTGFSLYLNKATKHPKEAVDFLRFLTSYESGRSFMAKSGWITALRKVPIPPEIVSDLSPADGIVAGACYCNAGSEATRLFWNEVYRMTRPHGSVEDLTKALDEKMPKAMRMDLETEEHNQRLTLAPRDVGIAAVGALAREKADDAALRLRRERLESAQNQSEGLTLYLGQQLRSVPRP